ncbi:divisome protein SepX/GlpR [Actinomadura parmotrematis]|uniref:Uncharacterized protein n=1 Tax=Actinomadura parmotrematis TaxID=2864039 RepID=A0ABS7FMU2_9ACTN|nr:hypothetical protein [Actinomadura parmotrematis]MBW8481698.1 hypothetical protein [Actinomadura parmotrematis]
MSSAVLYLAIVAVWAIVLVPMWLRRDTEATGVSRFLHKRGDEALPEESAALDDEPEQEPEQDATTTAMPPPAPRRPRRATVIARRRRRTAGLTLLLLTSLALVPTDLAPWWITVPPVLLLAGHLALLRVAVGMDAANHRAAAEAARAAREARAAAAAAAARAAEETPDPADHAEIIELTALAEEEVFDQYAADRRAVGE